MILASQKYRISKKSANSNYVCMGEMTMGAAKQRGTYEQRKAEGERFRAEAEKNARLHMEEQKSAQAGEISTKTRLKAMAICLMAGIWPWGKQ